jgi:hypothetical protein
MPENDGQQNGAGGEGGQGGETLTWEGVLEGLTEDQRGVYEAHTQGLRSALENERGQRRTLAGQLREATAGLEEGSVARTQLEEATAALEQAEQRATFAEEAVGQGVTNARLAWLAALEIEAFDRRGLPNWDALRKGFPELFGRLGAAPAGNAGRGTGGEPPGGASMNTFIRRSTGRE